MKNLEKFLKAYRLNLENFDLDMFLDDVLDIPHQVAFLEANIEALNQEQREEFFALNKKLAELLRSTDPKNEMQKKALKLLLDVCSHEVKEGHIAA